jgi:putative membrane protein
MSNATHQASAWQPPVELDMHHPDPAAAPAAVAATTAAASAAARAGEASGLAALAAWPQWSWTVPAFFGGVAALVVVALAFDATDLMGRSFAASYALGVLVTVVLAVTVGTAVKLSLDEVISIRRLRQIDGLRAEADRLTRANGHGEALGFADTLGDFYAGRADLAPVLHTLGHTVNDAHSDAEVIALIDRQVLSALDQRAYRFVLTASRDTALATALSPSAALDVAIVLWRNLKLVREVAALYGARPGPLGSWRLMRRMLANLAVAGLADSVGHVAVDALGGSLAAAISTRLGQGMINGLLTARIGIAAMTLCRPVGFSPDNKPNLKRIRAELMSVPKEVL